MKMARAKPRKWINTPAAGLAPAVMDAIARGGTGTCTTDASARIHDSVGPATSLCPHLASLAAHGEKVA
jgi:hypothetical protein